MLFNTWTFAAFLPIVLLIYYSLDRRWQNYFLLVASYVFYGWWDYRFCSLLAVSTIVDFFCGQRIASAKSVTHRKAILMISCFVNLGILAFFKYSPLFGRSFFPRGDSVGHFLMMVPLPIGISFFTFQGITLLVDTFKSETTSQYTFLKNSSFADHSINTALFGVDCSS